MPNNQNNEKKYASLSTLQTFLANLRTTFSSIGHKHQISDLTDYKVDSSLSSTSTNPVQNKVLNNEFEEISEALNVYDVALDDKANVTHTHEISDVNNLQSTIDTINSNVDKKSQVQIVTTESTKTLPTLKIHKLTQEQYDQELENGTIDENALYLTPDEEIDLSGYATVEQLNDKANISHTHEISDVNNLQVSLDELLVDAKSYTDGIALNKANVSHNHDEVYDMKGSANTALNSAKTYSDNGDATTLETAKTYTDNAVAQKAQIQIITWGVDD